MNSLPVLQPTASYQAGTSTASIPTVYTKIRAMAATPHMSATRPPQPRPLGATDSSPTTHKRDLIESVILSMENFVPPLKKFLSWDKELKNTGPLITEWA